MGYNLTIGEAVIARDDDFIRIHAESVSHPDAPAFGEPTDHTSSRWPSYTVWADFCRQAGIEELFFGGGWVVGLHGGGYAPCSDNFHRETPMLAEHPGVAVIMPADADYVRAALTRYQAKHPDVEPGFTESNNVAAATLARLIWLDYWFDWAVKNCTNPVLANS